MKHIRQPPGSRICGQACVAMLANVEVEDAIAACLRKGATSYPDLRRGLFRLGLKGHDRINLRVGQLPKDRLAIGAIFDMPPDSPYYDARSIARIRKSGSRWGGHWVAIAEGKVWDPGPEPVAVMSLHEYASYLTFNGLRFTSYMPVTREG